MMTTAEVVSRLPVLRDEARIPTEALASHPVPVIDRDLSLEFLFCPWSVAPPAPPILRAPFLRMRVSLETGKAVTSPVQRGDYDFEGEPNDELGEHHFDPPLAMDEFLALRAVLHQEIDALMDVLPTLPHDPGASIDEHAVTLRDTFERIAQKPLLPFYRAINPRFFDWLDERRGSGAA